MKSVWSSLAVSTLSSTNKLITKYIVSMIKVCFCSNNDGDSLNLRASVDLCLFIKTSPFALPPGGGLRNNEISQKFIDDHIFYNKKHSCVDKMCKAISYNLYFES